MRDFKKAKKRLLLGSRYDESMSSIKSELEKFLEKAQKYSQNRYLEVNMGTKVLYKDPKKVNLLLLYPETYEVNPARHFLQAFFSSLDLESKVKNSLSFVVFSPVLLAKLQIFGFAEIFISKLRTILITGKQKLILRGISAAKSVSYLNPVTLLEIQA